MVNSETLEIKVKISDQKVAKDVTVGFKYYFEGFGVASKEKYPHVVQPLDPVTVPAKTKEISVKLQAVRVGRVAIGFTSNDTKLKGLKEEYVSVYVVHSASLKVFTDILSWGYFFAWSLIRFPLIYTIFRNKSSAGVSMDMALLNFTGGTAFMIYICSLYFSKSLIDEYHVVYPQGSVPASVQDVIYVINAAVTSGVLTGSCEVYREEKSRFKGMTLLVVGGLCVYGVVLLICGGAGALSGLDTVQGISLIKMIVNPITYLPQIWKNHERQSTKGFNILFCWFDLTGGSLLLLRIILVATNASDLEHFKGQLQMFILSMVAIVLDLVLMFQHYILFRHSAGPYANIDGDNIEK